MNGNKSFSRLNRVKLKHGIDLGHQKRNAMGHLKDKMDDDLPTPP
jgi:hypothetical protein